MKLRFLLIALALGFAGSRAMADDNQKSWGGFYFGGNLGFGIGKDGQEGSWRYPVVALPQGLASFDYSQHSDGLLGGGQLGWNYELSPIVVVGIEADFQASDLSSSKTGTGVGLPIFGVPQTVTVVAEQRLAWFGTLRGRVGTSVLNPNLLIYATGGLAYGKVKSKATLDSGFRTFIGAFAEAADSDSETRLGWTAGAGVEYAVLKDWSLKAEYIFTDLGSFDIAGRAFREFAVGGLFDYSREVSAEFHTLRVGFNHPF